MKAHGVLHVLRASEPDVMQYNRLESSGEVRLTQNEAAALNTVARFLSPFTLVDVRLRAYGGRTYTQHE